MTPTHPQNGSDEVVDAQVRTVAVRSADPPSLTLFGSSDPTVVIERATSVATALKRVVDSQGLAANISGKHYPLVEAWTLVGSMLGVFPVDVWTRPMTEGDITIGWEARVEAVTRDGAVVGAAESMCTRREERWKTADDYALRGMAQTRATSRALRMPLDFVMKLAGYQTTPAEEMTGGGYATASAPQTGPTGLVEGAACPECQKIADETARTVNVGRLRPAKGGPHKGMLQCSGKVDGEWANHVPALSMPVEAPEPTVEGMPLEELHASARVRLNDLAQFDQDAARKVVTEHGWKEDGGEKAGKWIGTLDDPGALVRLISDLNEAIKTSPAPIP